MTLDELAKAKGFTSGELAQFGVRNGQGGVVIPYFDAAGNQYIKYRIRSEERKFRWSLGDAELIPYGLNRPVPYTRGAVWIVEGESDCWAAWLSDIPALGLPGASATKPLRAEHVVEAHTVLVVQEPGDAGSSFPDRVALRLYDDGFTGEVFRVVLPAKDIRELWCENRSTVRNRLLLAYNARKLVERPSSQSFAPKALQSVSLADVWEEPTEVTDWLIDGLLPRGGIMLLAAKAKSGKSVLARNMALSVARGSRFLGRRCEGGVILWLALEEQKAHVVSSFKAMGAQPTDPIRFFFGGRPAEAIRWLEAECAANQVALLVVDTWHRLTGIENVNDYAEVNNANTPLLRLARERGISQVWVHHANKGEAINGDQVLGSSALFAACDTLLTIKRANDETRAVWSIQRVGEDMEETIVDMDGRTYLLTSRGSRYAVAVEAARRDIEKVLADESLTRDDLCRRVEARRQYTLAALDAALRDGVVEATSGTGKKGDPRRFGLVEGVSPKTGDSDPFDDREIPFAGSRSRKGTTGTHEPENIVVPNSREPNGTEGTSGTQGTIGTSLLGYASEVLGA